MAPFLQWVGPAIAATHLQLIRHLTRTHFNALPLAAHKLEVYASLAAVSVLSRAVLSFVPAASKPKPTTLLFLAAYSAAIPALARSGRWVAEMAGALGPEWGAVVTQVVLCAPVVAMMFPFCTPPVTRQGVARPFVALCAAAIPVSLLAWVSDLMESNAFIAGALADEPELGMLGICMMLNALSVVYLWMPEDVPAPANPPAAAAAPVKGSEEVDAAVGKKGKKNKKKDAPVVEKKEDQPPTDRPVAQAYPLRGRRPSHFTLALRSLPLLTAFAGFAVSREAPFAEDGVRIHKSMASVTGRVVVGDNIDGGYRFLRNDKTIIGGVWLHDINAADPTGLSATLGDSIFAAMPLQEIGLLARTPAKDDKVLVLGLGAGIGASYYAESGLDVTVVDVDPAVVDAAREYFGMPDVTVEVADGAMWVNRAANESTTKYQYIVHDVFSAGGLPAHLFTKEFWAEAKQILAPEGVVVMNMAGPVRSPLTRRIVATLVSEFPTCRAFTDVFSSSAAANRVMNFVFVCSPAGMPEFRKATKADMRDSVLREMVYTHFEGNEVPIAEFLKTDSEAELEEDVIIRRGTKRDGQYDLELAKDVWESVRSLLPTELWVAY